MIQTLADLVWHTMAMLSGMMFLVGGALCAVHASDPEGRKPPIARRVLRALGSILRKASYRCERIAYRLF